MNAEKYMRTTNASKYFNVSPNTIRDWDSRGIIKAIRINGQSNGHRLYDISTFSNKSDTSTVIEYSNATTKKKIIYCRVSSRHQKDDLDRQVKCMSDKFPNYEIITDIGSGINFKRKGFLKLIDGTINGSIGEIVVAHKDRLARFAFELIKCIFVKFGVKLVVLDETINKSTEQELAEDLLAIIHVFSCRQNRKRKYISTTTN